MRAATKASATNEIEPKANQFKSTASYKARIVAEAGRSSYGTATNIAAAASPWSRQRPTTPTSAPSIEIRQKSLDTGLTAPCEPFAYGPPAKADLTFDTSKQTVEDCVDAVVDLLKSRELI